MLKFTLENEGQGGSKWKTKKLPKKSFAVLYSESGNYYHDTAKNVAHSNTVSETAK